MAPLAAIYGNGRMELPLNSNHNFHCERFPCENIVGCKYENVVTNSENTKTDPMLISHFCVHVRISNCPAARQGLSDLDAGMLAISIAKFLSTGNKSAPCTTQAAGAGTCDRLRSCASIRVKTLLAQSADSQFLSRVVSTLSGLQ